MSSPPTLRAAIVDDEQHCIDTLTWELATFCPEVELVGSFGESLTALEALPTLRPDVLFLDIEMPKLNGFQLLSQLEGLQSHIIFTTAYSEYAVKAFHYNAVDYLLKPIDPDRLKQAVAKVPVEGAAARPPGSLRLLYDTIDELRADVLPTRLSLPTSEGYELIKIRDIIRCQSDGCYTDLYLKNDRKFTVSRNLKQLERALEAHSFRRVHHSHLVNFKHIIRFSRTDGGIIEMSDGSEVLVSRSRREALLGLLR